MKGEKRAQAGGIAKAAALLLALGACTAIAEKGPDRQVQEGQAIHGANVEMASPVPKLVATPVVVYVQAHEGMASVARASVRPDGESGQPKYRTCPGLNSRTGPEGQGDRAPEWRQLAYDPEEVRKLLEEARKVENRVIDAGPWGENA